MLNVERGLAAIQRRHHFLSLSVEDPERFGRSRCIDEKLIAGRIGVCKKRFDLIIRGTNAGGAVQIIVCITAAIGNKWLESIECAAHSALVGIEVVFELIVGIHFVVVRIDIRLYERFQFVESWLEKL